MPQAISGCVHLKTGDVLDVMAVEECTNEDGYSIWRVVGLDDLPLGIPLSMIERVGLSYVPPKSIVFLTIADDE